MKLDARIDRLEAAQTDPQMIVTTIVLTGPDDHGPIAVSTMDGEGRSSPFTLVGGTLGSRGR